MLEEFCSKFIFSEFFRKISTLFFPSRTFYLRNRWSDWCETKRKLVKWRLSWLGYLLPWLTFNLDPWPWIFKVKLYLRNWRPDCHGMKGTGVDRMPCCETLRNLVNWTLRWLGYLSLWPLTLNFQCQIVSWEWEARLSWNERDRCQ